MADTSKDLGRLISVHPVSPVYVQRAVFISVLSFLFFLAMMLAYYIRQSLGYFLLATAFLIVYLVMMFSWFSQRKAVVSVFENGIRYKDHSLSWDDIRSVSETAPILITPNDGKAFQLPGSIAGPEALASYMRSRVAPATSSDQ